MGRFGVSRIVDLLRGSRSKALLAYGAEGCPGYGVYQACSKVAMTRLVKDLVDLEYLRVEGLDYPTLDVTRLGQEVLQGTGVVSLRKPAAHPMSEGLSPQSGQGTRSVPASNASPADPQLFERLRRLRLELAA